MKTQRGGADIKNTEKKKLRKSAKLMKVQKSFCYHNHTPSTIWSPFPPPRMSKPQAPEGRAGLEERSQAAALLSFPPCILLWRMRSEEPKWQSHIPLLAPSSNTLNCTHGPRCAPVGNSCPKPPALLDHLEGAFLFL